MWLNSDQNSDRGTGLLFPRAARLCVPGGWMLYPWHPTCWSRQAVIRENGLQTIVVHCVGKNAMLLTHSRTILWYLTGVGALASLQKAKLHYPTHLALFPVAGENIILVSYPIFHIIIIYYHPFHVHCPDIAEILQLGQSIYNCEIGQEVSWLYPSIRLRVTYFVKSVAQKVLACLSSSSRT